MRWRISVLLVIALSLAPFSAWATSSSTNFKVEEDYVGGGGLLNSSSASFQSKESIGDVAVGETGSTNFQTNNGFTTTNDPTLAFSVTGSSIDFSTLSPSTTATGTATFSVKNYTSWGYVVLTTGNGPTNHNHVLTGLSSPTSPTPGTEQFGINLIDNSSPDIGANPVQVPSSSFSNGVVASGYDQLNKFKYVEGDAIASAPKSSGETDYTISYIANVNAITTPGGQYTMSHVLVVVGTY
ncbi:MAG TPA: hypothetical protein VLF41_00960 [Candidatus Nanoarchaeia archaeon]|nr:hypothetical protein [Candidatus Nanoarchaeia archaeon]